MYGDYILFRGKNAEIEDVEQKIADLKKIRGALLQMVSKCTGIGPVGECPILESLSQR
jgi:hypothetical protein